MENIEVLYDKLGYLSTRELWEIMSLLGLQYATLSTTKKENLETKEEIEVPKVTPRTDYDRMKSEIVVTLSLKNREQRRTIEKRINKIYTKRKKLLDTRGEE